MKKLNPIDLKLNFPIDDKLDGWYFRIEEISNGGWEASGSDLFGRIVSKTGSDPEILLDECIEKATEIQSSL